MATQPSHILILTSTYPRWDHDSTPGFVADFATSLARDIAEVSVLAPHYKGARTRERQGRVSVRRYRYFLPSSGETIAYNGGAVSKITKTPLYALKLLCFMAALFFSTLTRSLSGHVDIINAHWLIPQGFAAVLVKLLTGKKVVITIHGGDVLSLNGKYMRIVKAYTLRHADVVCVNSSVTLAACESLYAREYRRIPMGIDVSRYQDVPGASAIKTQYDLRLFTILYVGRFAKEKGIIYLLQALKQLKDAGAHFQALIIGSGPLDQELRAYVLAEGLEDCVIMPGWVDSATLPAYYKAADLFVGPSLHEAQGLVFLEALAAGLPVLTTTGGGMVDFMQDGINGYMVAPGDAQALVEKINLLMGDPELLRKLHAQAAPSIANRYSWDDVGRDYIDVFSKVSQ